MHIGLVYAEFDILCLIIMTVITVMTLSMSKKLVHQGTYLTMMVFGSILVGADMFYELAIADIIHIGLFGMYLANCLYFSASVLIAHSWFVYSQKISETNLIYNKKFMCAIAIPDAVANLFIALTPWTGWIFELDENGFYSRGALNAVTIAVPALYFISAVIWAIVNHVTKNNERTKANLKTVISFVVIPIGAVIVQLMYEGYPIICIGAMFGMLWVFIYNIAKERETMAANQLLADARSQFFASMSHEIRTPINAVIGMNTMILREATDPQIIGYANAVEDSGKLLLSIINDILDFSKAESGKLSLVYCQYETADVIRDLVSMIQPKIGEKKLEFNIEVDENLPKELYGDDVRLKQVVMNLLTNAVKYTEKGSVTLRITFREISSESIGLTVLVRDTGQGISRENLKTLFSPYARFEEKMNRRIEGTGLGMSIVKSILALMESELVVESEYGKGSDFSFEIIQRVRNSAPIGPKESYLKPKTEVAKRAKTFSAPLAHILVVDDTAINLSVFTALLKHTQMQIDTASSGPEALEKVKDNTYDIIFMDHMMPGMDGIEAYEKMLVEENTVTDNTPVIMLSANVTESFRMMFVNAGFIDFLGKPIDADKLEKMIRTYLPEELVHEEESVQNTGKVVIVNEGKVNYVPGMDESELILNERKSEAFDPVKYLKSLTVLSYDEGVKASNNEEILFLALNSYLDQVEEKTELIERLQKEKDYKNYAVEVHALKSNSRLIGATELGNIAEKLEHTAKDIVEALENGKDGADIASKEEIIEIETPNALRKYGEVAEAIRPVCNKG